MSSGTVCTISLVRPDWRSSPSTRVSMSASSNEPSVSMTGPSGQNVS